MRSIFTLLLVMVSSFVFAQSRVNPVIKSFGGIYDIPEATVKPDPKLEYKIVVDVYGGAENKTGLDMSLNNVARMLNLHAVGGVDPSKMDVVLALHGNSTYSTMNDESYKRKYGVDNPNTLLIKELKDAGVKIAVCGQSLKARGVAIADLNPNIQIATSMLTTVTSHQLQGYKLLKF